MKIECGHKIRHTRHSLNLPSSCNIKDNNKDIARFSSNLLTNQVITNQVILLCKRVTGKLYALNDYNKSNCYIGIYI